MSSYTKNVNLYKADPVADGNDTFNIETMMNDNWDKIDKALFKGVTTGTASALLLEGLPEEEGQKVQLKLHINISDGATLNGKPILLSEGEPISAGALVGSFLMLVFNAEKKCWYQIGSSGGGFYIKIAGSNKKAYLEFNPKDGVVYVKEA